MMLSFEVESKHDALQIIYLLTNAADHHKQRADSWITRIGEKGDSVDVELLRLAKMFESVARSLGKQVKQMDAARADAVNS